MTGPYNVRPWWSRREFLKSSVAVAAGAYGLSPSFALAAPVPEKFDGSAFKLKAPEPSAKSGGVLRHGMPLRAPHFDIHQAGTIFILGAAACMFDNLIRRDPNDGAKTIIPDLAHSWEISPDGQTYTFHLRQGVQFHDGAELTSEDVKATYDRIAKPPTGVSIPRSVLFKAVSEINARQVYGRIQAVGAPPDQLHDVGVRQRLECHRSQKDAGRQQLQFAEVGHLPRHRSVSQRSPRRERTLGDGAESELLEQGAAVSRRDRVLSRAAVFAGNGFGNSLWAGRLCAYHGSGYDAQSPVHARLVNRQLQPERDPRDLSQQQEKTV